MWLLRRKTRFARGRFSGNHHSSNERYPNGVDTPVANYAEQLRAFVAPATIALACTKHFCRESHLMRRRCGQDVVRNLRSSPSFIIRLRQSYPGLQT